MRPRVLVIDNVDSFTFNVVAELEHHVECRVITNDTELPSDLGEKFDGVVISPGPCNPSTAGVSLTVCEQLLAGLLTLPMLGVCLGHQTLAHVAGASVLRAKRAVHGKVIRVEHDGRGLFDGLRGPLSVARYNSLTVDEASLPAELIVTARSEGEHEVMGLAHRTRPLASVQFHPESHLSDAAAARIFENFSAWAHAAMLRRASVA